MEKSQCDDVKRSELILNKIMDISTDGFLVIDDKGRIIGINKSYLRFLGLSRQDVVGKFVLDIIKNSRLSEILVSGETEIDVLHKFFDDQEYGKEKVVVVTRSAVKDGNTTIGAVGQIKFSNATKELAKRLQRIDSELEYYKNELTRITGSYYSFANMVGQSSAFMEVKTIASQAACNDFTVLLTGESGTGKEVFAHAIHNASSRANKAFIRINCAAIPAELLEAELFGYEEGAFTGAKKGGKKGKFELAQGGTIFLDEIGDMPYAMQSKILRVLQEREFERVGGERAYPLNIRIVAATNQDLEHLINEKKFRSDLYYRLNVIPIRIPTLTERKEDIPLLAQYFLDQIKNTYRSTASFSDRCLAALAEYSWPGNIRELRNVIERAYNMLDGDVITTNNLPLHIINCKKGLRHFPGKTLPIIMQEVEKDILIEVLKANRYNHSAAAKALGIERATLYKKLNKYKIEREHLMLYDK